MSRPVYGAERRCLVIMRNNHEPCWRLKGHGGEHRSRYAIENARTYAHVR